MKILNKYLQALFIFTFTFLIGFYAWYNTFGPQKWYKKTNMVVHAMGEIDGHDYTNSKEAFEKGYSYGYRVFEIDMQYTSDRRLVLRHNWKDDLGQSNIDGDNVPDYEIFMNTPIWSQYSPLDIESILTYLDTYPDLYFVTDIKGSILDEALQDIISTANKMGYESVLDRFIIQFYSIDDYKKICTKYNFKNYIFTTYRMFRETPPTVDIIREIDEFCRSNGIDVLTVNKKYLTKDLLKEWKKVKTPLFIHTIADNSTILGYVKEGINGFYIDDTQR